MSKILLNAFAFFGIAAGLMLLGFVLASCFAHPMEGGRMNWLEFVSELIKALAWPVVVVVLAFQFRERFHDLLGRLTEATLPGGFSGKFSRVKAGLAEVEKVVKASAVEGDLQADSPVLAPADDPIATLSNPTGVIMEAWLSVQTALGIFLGIVDPSLRSMARRSDIELLKDLLKHSAITNDEFFALQTLRNIRNNTAHNTVERPTPQDAERFVAAVNLVLGNIAARMPRR